MDTISNEAGWAKVRAALKGENKEYNKAPVFNFVDGVSAMSKKLYPLVPEKSFNAFPAAFHARLGRQ